MLRTIRAAMTYDYINASYVNVSMCVVAVQFIALTCGCIRSPAHITPVKRRACHPVIEKQIGWSPRCLDDWVIYMYILCLALES